jgi:hypothetical protein
MPAARHVEARGSGTSVERDAGLRCHRDVTVPIFFDHRAFVRSCVAERVKLLLYAYFVHSYSILRGLPAARAAFTAFILFHHAFCCSFFIAYPVLAFGRLREDFGTAAEGRASPCLVSVSSCGAVASIPSAFHYLPYNYCYAWYLRGAANVPALCFRTCWTFYSCYGSSCCLCGPMSSLYPTFSVGYLSPVRTGARCCSAGAWRLPVMYALYTMTLRCRRGGCGRRGGRVWFGCALAAGSLSRSAAPPPAWVLPWNARTGRLRSPPLRLPPFSLPRPTKYTVFLSPSSLSWFLPCHEPYRRSSARGGNVRCIVLLGGMVLP